MSYNPRKKAKEDPNKLLVPYGKTPAERRDYRKKRRIKANGGEDEEDQDDLESSDSVSAGGSQTSTPSPQPNKENEIGQGNMGQEEESRYVPLRKPKPMDDAAQPMSHGRGKGIGRPDLAESSVGSLESDMANISIRGRGRGRGREGGGAKPFLRRPGPPP